MEQERQVTLTLTVNQLNTVLAGIIKLSIEMGLETFQVVQQQANQQLGIPNTQAPNGPLGNKVVQ
jgi:hypothetical protein